MAMPSGAYSSQQAMQEKVPSGYKKFALNQYTPQQQELFGQEFAHLGPESYLSRLASGDESMFSEMEAPALRQFGELQGNLASRFSGMGMGARKGSGFQNTMGSAASNFAQDLQSKRMELRNKAIMDLMGLSNQVLNQRPQEQGLVQKQKKPGWGEFVSSLFGGAPGMATGDSQGAVQGMMNIGKFAMGL